MRRVANSESWSKSGGGENFDRTAWLWLGDKAMAAAESEKVNYEVMRLVS